MFTGYHLQWPRLELALIYIVTQIFLHKKSLTLMCLITISTCLQEAIYFVPFRSTVEPTVVF